jgi:hypothetical protein
MADSITPDGRAITMIMTVGRRDLQFNISFKPWLGPSIFHFPEVLSLAEVKTSVCEQKNQHTDMTCDRIQVLLNDSPVSYTKTTRSP